MTKHIYTVRYFGNLSDIDDRVRNISWQTLNLTQNLTLTLILTLTLNPNHIHTYIYTAIYVRRVAEIMYAFTLGRQTSSLRMPAVTKVTGKL